MFRVPISTFQSRQTVGLWKLLDIAVICMVLLLRRIYVQVARPGTVMAAWLPTWGLTELPPNPPNAASYPIGTEHVRAYALVMAYVSPLRPDDTPRLWLKRINWVLHTMAAVASPVTPILIFTMHLHYDWSRICENLYSASIPDAFRPHGIWYCMTYCAQMSLLI